MTGENYWSTLSDDEVFSAEQKISDYKPKAQREILKEANRRRGLVVELGKLSQDSRPDAWVCGNCGEQVEGDYEACWNCQSDREKSNCADKKVADTTVPPVQEGRPKPLARSLGAQLERRYRDAYRVARATTFVAGLVKFIGISLMVVGVGGALVIGEKTAEIAVLVGVLGVSSGMLVFGVGVLIAAQGQHLLAAIDDVVGNSPFLNDSERADIMRLEVGNEE